LTGNALYRLFSSQQRGLRPSRVPAISDRRRWPGRIRRWNGLRRCLRSGG